MLHVGHVRILKRARRRCDHLIVGVASDDLCLSRKGKQPVQTQEERIEIVSAIRFVDKVILQDSFDNIADWKRLRFNILFKGSDWKGHPDWVQTEAGLAPLGVRVVFLPYTHDISTSKLRKHYVS